MVKIIHLADVHFASPLSSLPDIKKGSIRRAEIKQTFQKVVSYAVSSRADLVLIPGDLFNNRYVSLQTLKEVMDVFCGAKELLFFISPGNHDCADASSFYRTADFPENVTVFLEEAIQSVYLPKLNTRVYGAAFCSPSVEKSLLDGFCVSSQEETNIMVLHGDVGNPSSIYNPISEAMIAQSGLNYLALGHVHAYSGIKKAGKTTYAYSGCLEPRGFDETGKKGYIEGSVGKEGCDLVFKEASKRQYREEEINIEGCESHFDVIRKVEAQNFDPDGIYRFILTGSLAQPEIVSEKALAEHFAGRFFDFQFKNRTRLAIDKEKISKERSLKGVFVRNMEVIRQNAADEDEAQRAELALRYGLDALLGNELDLI